jgi:DNA-binding NarL/FixJ family response regulator
MTTKRESFIASTNGYFINDMKEQLNAVDKSMILTVTGTWSGLLENLSPEEHQSVFFDRDFLGLNFEDNMRSVFARFQRIPAAVLMYGQCEPLFGFRLYKQGFNCIIPGFEKKDVCRKILYNFILGGKNYFPDEIHTLINNRDYLLFPDCYREITPSQITILKKIAKGKTLDQVSRESKCARGTVASQLFRIRRKLGARTNADAVRICISAGLLNVKSGDFYDCKD